jgi:PAS domain S-box-containing protein
MHLISALRKGRAAGIIAAMRLVAILPIVMAALCAFAGLSNLLIYVRRRDQAVNLSFPVMCLLMAFYDLLCAGLYSSGSITDGARWQWAQIIAIALCSAAVLNFIADYTGKVSRAPRIVFTSWFVVEAAVGLFGGIGVVLDVAHPLVKRVNPLTAGIVTYYEAAPGPIANLQSFGGLLLMIYVCVACVRLLVTGPRSKAVPMLVVVALLLAAAANDTLVSSGVLGSFYLVEYAFMAMVLLMSYSLINQVIEAARTKDALVASEDKYRTLVENQEEGVTIVDPKERFLFANPAADALFAVAPGSLAGRFLSDFLDDEQLPVLLDQTASRRRGEKSRYELCIRSADGRKKTVIVTATPQFGPAGEFRGTFAILRDETEQRVLEERLRQSQKMEAVGRFAGGIAHDFSNVITIINGYTEIMRDSVRAGSALWTPLERIREATGRAASVSRQLLAFSRRQDLPRMPTDLNSLLRDLEDPLRRLIGEDVTIRVERGADTGAILADKGQIEQIILNLAANARDAMPTGGTLTLRTGVTRVAGREEDGRPRRLAPGDYAVLTVRDTGVGMGPEVIEHLFEPFFTTKGPGKGTGLGLAMAFGIVMQSKGDIVVDSAPGRGTSVTISLPRVDPPAAAVDPAFSAPPPGGCESILVVEDEEGVRRLTCSILRLLGYTVIETSTGEEAVAVLEDRSRAIDLVLSDVVMPVMGGHEVTRRAAALRPGIRTMLMSGYPDGGAAGDMGAASGTPFLRKPFTRDSLARKVREALGSG